MNLLPTELLASLQEQEKEQGQARAQEQQTASKGWVCPICQLALAQARLTRLQQLLLQQQRRRRTLSCPLAL
jgi:hypothetical protein